MSATATQNEAIATGTTAEVGIRKPAASMADDEFAKLAVRRILEGAEGDRLTEAEVFERVRKLERIKIEGVTLDLILAGEVLARWDGGELLIRAAGREA